MFFSWGSTVAFSKSGGIVKHSMERLTMFVRAGTSESIQDVSRVVGMWSMSQEVDLLDKVTFLTSSSVPGVNAERSASAFWNIFQGWFTELMINDHELSISYSQTNH